LLVWRRAARGNPSVSANAEPPPQFHKAYLPLLRIASFAVLRPRPPALARPNCPPTGAPAKAGTKAILPRSLRLHEKPGFAGPPLHKGAFRLRRGKGDFGVHGVLLSVVNQKLELDAVDSIWYK
jgi:hypothetical protein